MNFIDRIINSDDYLKGNWKQLTSEAEADKIITSNGRRAQVIFKHSSSCGTSFMAKQSLDKIPANDLEQTDLYIVNVVKDRPVSMYLANKLGIRHESPQLIVIKDAEVVWHGSHFNVTSENMLQALG